MIKSNYVVNTASNGQLLNNMEKNSCEGKIATLQDNPLPLLNS